MKKLVIATLIFGLSGLSYAKTYQDNMPVILEGTIQTKTGYGPPNYGNPKTDKKITYQVLKLKSPIDFNDTEGFSGDVSNVREMHSYTLNKSQPLPKSGCIVANGILFGAQTAHHRTPVMFEISDFKSCK